MMSENAVGFRTIERPNYRATIDEDSLTDSIFDGASLRVIFTGTKAHARELAREMLAGPALRDAAALLVKAAGALRAAVNCNYDPIVIKDQGFVRAVEAALIGVEHASGYPLLRKAFDDLRAANRES